MISLNERHRITTATPAAPLKAAIFNNGVDWAGDEPILAQVYGAEGLKKLAEISNLYPHVITSENFAEHADRLRDLEVIFSTWGMVELTRSQVAQLPRLKALFYAAGATRSFRTPFLERNVKVSSGTAANAIPVAEFALGQILLAGAGFFRCIREYTGPAFARSSQPFKGCGNYRKRVSILGEGAVSRQLQRFLASHDLEVVVVSSWPERRRVSLEEAFATSFALVNAFPNCEDNVGIFNAPLFESMMPSAVFINVGRGPQVNHSDLIAVMKRRPDLTASLDVQWPEPPPIGSELYSLPNVLLTPHNAGTKGKEMIRLADFMIDEYLRFQRGEPLLHEVQADQL